MNAKLPQIGRDLWCRMIVSTLLTAACVSTRAADDRAPLRAGMIGLDTSHVPASAKLFNNQNGTGDLAGIKRMAGSPGGTDIPASRDRVGKFTEELRGMG